MRRRADFGMICPPPAAIRPGLGGAMPRILLLLVCLATLGGLAACNTIAGIGSDISDTALWTKRHL